MKEIIIDAGTGQPIDVLKERNEAIIRELFVKMEDLRVEQSADTRGNKRFGFRAMMQIEDKLMQFPLMSAEKFSALDCDEIDYYWRSFHSLMSHYNMTFELVPTRQTFMLYMGVNSRMYKKLINGGEREDEDIKDLMTFIEDRLVGKAFTAGESGNADSKSISARLRAKDVGHSVITASEDKIIESTEKRTPKEIEKKLIALLGG